MINIRLAQPGDGAGIVASVQSGFDRSLLSAFLYGACGMADYIDTQIAMRDWKCDTIFSVACDDDKVVGSVELRSVGQDVFLNYIALLPDYRSKGLGAKLLKTALEMYDISDKKDIFLDVLTTNTLAKNWYERMGFQTDYFMTWWSLPLEKSSKKPNGMVAGYPQCCACYDRFGFGQFRLITAGGDYNVGLMCTDWFRIVQPSALIDPDVPASLNKVDSSRRILSILQDGHLPLELMGTAEAIATSVRLRCDVKGLAGRLL